ncbi:MAG: hypothetical protein OCC46_07390 [Pseudodesulfovibrio sp.]
MSNIASIEALSEYAPRSYEDKQEEVEPAKAQAADNVLAPVAKAEAAALDAKTTIQDFKYTGKGSFIDGIF